jgi:hypothetical protein
MKRRGCESFIHAMFYPRIARGETLVFTTSILKGSAVHPASPRMLPKCLRPLLSRASAALDNMTRPEHSKFCRRWVWLRSSLSDERHRLDKLAFESRLPIGKLPPVDA